MDGGEERGSRADVKEAAEGRSEAASGPGLEAFGSVDRCGGCGRRIDLPRMAPGSKYLCARCWHLQSVPEGLEKRLDHRLFLALAAASLFLVSAAAFTLCVLYLLGTGKAPWFGVLLAATFLLAAVPSLVLSRWRNISLLAASLYLPLGLWALLWYLAPGVNWQMGDTMAWGGASFFALGSLGLYLFFRDRMKLTRL